MKKIAIIGAGLSGLVTAKMLSRYANVTVYEKSHRSGGRISTRNADPYYFDHGAQFFKVTHADFSDFIQPMIAHNIIQPWNGRFVEFDQDKIIQQRQWDTSNPHYVGTPSMSEIGRFLSQDLTIQHSTRIICITKQPTGWLLTDEQNNHFGEYDWVILAMPAAQTTALIPEAVSFTDQVAAKTMDACYSLMLGFDKSLPVNFDAALVHGVDISWISVNNSKPQRGQPFTLLVHSTNQWANEHLEDDPQMVMQHLIEQVSNIIGHDASIAAHKAIHKWRYANCKKQQGEKYFIDDNQKIAACGDWCIQGRI